MEHDKLASLRIIKIPIHKLIIGNIRAWWNAYRARRKARRAVHMIATVKAWTYWTDEKRYDFQAYVCYETGKGRRFYKRYCSSPLLELRKKEQNQVFITLVLPWLNGQRTNELLQSAAAALDKQKGVHAR